MEAPWRAPPGSNGACLAALEGSSVLDRVPPPSLKDRYMVLPQSCQNSLPCHGMIFKCESISDTTSSDFHHHGVPRQA
jgi:hypothetical protein